MPSSHPYSTRDAGFRKSLITKARNLPLVAAASGGFKQSAFTCSLTDGVPLERIIFEVPANTVNFNRTVVVSDEKGSELERGSISRVRLSRAGQTVVSEDLALDLNLRTTNRLAVAIKNGDDAPLPILQVRPLSVERRVYFDPKGKSALKLYYGDAKLQAPSMTTENSFSKIPIRRWPRSARERLMVSSRDVPMTAPGVNVTTGCSGPRCW